MGRSCLFAARSRLMAVQCWRRWTEGSSVWPNSVGRGLLNPASGGRRRGPWRWCRGSPAHSGISAAVSGSC